MREDLAVSVGEKCNYSSSELGVEREVYLLQYFDFQCTLLDFLKPMISMVLERMISKVAPGPNGV